MKASIFPIQAANVVSILAHQPGFAPAIPLYDNPVAAGFPSPAADHVEDRLSADDYLVGNPTATYFVRVKGDSMIEAGIFDGDVLVVDRSIKPSLGHIVLAEVDGEFTVKYLGRGKLLPANGQYQPILFKEGQTVEVIGVVTGSMRRFV